MKTTVIISVHSTARNCFSSSDFNGYREFNSERDASNFINENKFAVNETYIDNELNLKLIYLTTLEFNRNRENIKQLFVKGFSEDARKYWDKQEDIKNAEMKEKGFVYCKKFDDMTTEDYKGALQNALTDITLKYISNKGVCGYLGHSFRQLEHDKHIEEMFNNVTVTFSKFEVNKWNVLSTWLTSSDARHWMNSIEDTNIEHFKEKFNAYIPELVLLGYIYSLDEHQGTYASTIKLKEKYKDRIKVVLA